MLNNAPKIEEQDPRDAGYFHFETFIEVTSKGIGETNYPDHEKLDRIYMGHVYNR